MGKIDKVKKVIKLAPRVFETLPKLKFYFGWHYKHSPVNEKQILFESFHGKTISDSPLYVLQEFVSSGRAEGFTIYYATKAENLAAHTQLVQSLGLPVRLVDVESREYPRVLATSKYLVNNSSFPAYFMRRPEQRYVQTWHGTPLKTLGKRMRLGIESMYNVQHNFIHANVLTFPNEFTRAAMMRDYNLERLFTGKVAMVGYPRNAVFLNPDQDEEAFRARYDLDGYENFAYMPTWRGTSNHDVSVSAYSKQINEIFSRLDAALRDDQRIYVNFHSMVASQIDLGSYGHIKAFPADADNYRFLNQMDALITDYSSVFFDFSLTRKPVILFIYDLDEYMHDRGMYFDITELPFQQVRTTEELADSLATGSFRGFDYRGSAYEEQFLCNDGPDNARRVLDLVFADPEPGPGVLDYSHNLQEPRAVVDPRRVKTTPMVDAVAHQAKRNDAIAIFPRTGFTQELSAHLHDRYRDDFDFMFITRTTPRTFVEEVIKHASRGTRAALAARERERVFGSLPTTKAVRDIYTGIVGDAVDIARHETCASTVTNTGDAFTFSLDGVPEGMDALRLVLISRPGEKSEVVAWARDFRQEELSSGCMTESFLQCMEDIADLRINGRFRLCVEATDAQGKLHLLYLTAPDNPVHWPCCAPATFDLGMPSEDDDRDSYARLCAGNGAVVVPYVRDERQEITILFTDTAHFAGGVMFAQLKSVRCGNDGLVRVKCTLPGGAYEVTSARMIHRGTDDLSYEVACDLREGGSSKTLTMTFDSSACELAEIYWDLRISGRMFGITSEMPVALTRKDSAGFMLANTQALPDSEHVFFPYSTKGRRLAFVYRQRSPHDTMATRVKEASAVAAYLLLRPYWRRKRVWLVYEKFCALAQDNGYFFFKYCMENLPESERSRIFYVIDKNSHDFGKVEAYGSNVVPFMSLRHMLYAMAADLYVASDSRTHLYLWRTKPSIIANRISKHDIFFLQHGVTAMKRVDYLFGKQGSSPMTYFVTTSKREQQIVTEHFGYSDTAAPICGFARWDALEDKSSAAHPMILVMPTWRPWFEEQSAEVFRQSEYFERYSSLIQSPRLLEFLVRQDATLIFYIHPKLSEQITNFSTVSDRVSLVPMGSRPLNEIMMASSALVTDYSSVCWDVLYMGKPVAYYQFDQQRYEDEMGSYVDLNRDLPGDVCFEEGELLDALEAMAARGFALTEEQEALAGEWFDQRDTRNSERTYRFLKGQGY